MKTVQKLTSFILCLALILGSLHSVYADEEESLALATEAYGSEETIAEELKNTENKNPDEEQNADPDIDQNRNAGAEQGEDPEAEQSEDPEAERNIGPDTEQSEAPNAEQNREPDAEQSKGPDIDSREDFHTEELHTQEINGTHEEESAESEGDEALFPPDDTLCTVEEKEAEDHEDRTTASYAYVLIGGETIPVEEITCNLGLTGPVTCVVTSDPSVVLAYEEEGVWLLVSARDFVTEEWMDVTIDDLVHHIILTDEPTPVARKTRKVSLSRSRGVDDTTITVNKIWVGDLATDRPDALTMTIAKTETTLQKGTELSAAMVSLAGDKNSVSAFQTGSREAYLSAATVIDVSVSGSDIPAYMWFDSGSGTIYLYSEADNIFLNENAAQMFDGYDALVDISGLADVNTAFVTNMFAMFRSCHYLVDLAPLAGWNTANVTSMRFMLGSGSTTIVQDQYKMHYTDLTPLAGWNTQSVTDMGSMFKGAKITSVAPIRNWNVSNVANMNSMFFRTYIDDPKSLIDWNVVRVGGTYINKGSVSALTPDGASTIGNFNQMFASLKDASTDRSILPVWTYRAGSWTSNSGAYNFALGEILPDSPAEVTPNVANATGSYPLIFSAVSADGNSWIYTLELPAGDGNGNFPAYNWHLYEEVPAYYTVSDGMTEGKGSAADPITGVRAGVPVCIFNTMQTQTIVAEKSWIDENNAYGTRPADLALSLATDRNGITVSRTETDADTDKVFAANVWRYTWTVAANETVISLAETVPDAYAQTAAPALNAQTGIYEIENTLRRGAVRVTKSTQENEPGSFTFRIKAWTGSGNTCHYCDFGAQGATAVTGETGAYTFALAVGDTVIQDSKTFTGIPYGFRYEIREETPNGWELRSVDGVTGSTNAAGTIASEATAAHTFHNASRHSLTITKAVSGNMADREEDFAFTVAVSSDAGEPVALSSERLTANGDGTYRFTLRHGDRLVLRDLPYGCTYEVEEEDHSDSGYVTRVDGAAGRTAAGTLTTDREHVFVSEKNVPLPTGRATDDRPWKTGVGMAVFLAMIWVCLEKKRWNAQRE